MFFWSAGYRDVNVHLSIVILEQRFMLCLLRFMHGLSETIRCQDIIKPDKSYRGEILPHLYVLLQVPGPLKIQAVATQLLGGTGKEIFVKY